MELHKTLRFVREVEEMIRYFLVHLTLFILCIYFPIMSYGAVVDANADWSIADKKFDQSILQARRANVALKRSYEFGNPNLSSLQAMLNSHNFKAIENQFEDMLQQYKEDVQYEQFLQASYGLFSPENGISIEDLDLWVKKTGSYIAYAARGIYKAKEGFIVRGDDFLNSIAPPSNSKIAEMRRLHQDAAKDLIIAINKNAALMPAYAWLVLIARATPMQLTPEQILQQAEENDKRTYFVRYMYIKSLQPRWGGSYEKMDAFAAQAVKYNALNPSLWTLQGEADGDRGETKLVEGDFKSAIEFYTAALKFGVRPQWLNKRALCYYNVGARDKSVADSKAELYYVRNDSAAFYMYNRNKKYDVEYELTENSFINPNIKKEGIQTYAVLPVEYHVELVNNKASEGMGIAKRNIDKIELMLLQLGFDCVERVKLEALLREQKLSLTGLTVDKAQYVGRLINADAVVITTIPSMGLHIDPYQYFEDIDIKAVSVASGKIIWKSNLKGNTLWGNISIDKDIILDNIETKLYDLLQSKLRKNIL
jgi:hypothetical protein